MYKLLFTIYCSLILTVAHADGLQCYGSYQNYAIETGNDVRDIIVDRVEVYEQADGSSATVGFLPKGEQIRVLSSKEDNPSFYKINHYYDRNMVEGYIPASALSKQNLAYGNLKFSSEWDEKNEHTRLLAFKDGELIDQTTLKSYVYIDGVQICSTYGLRNVDFIVVPHYTRESCPGGGYTAYYAWVENNFVFLADQSTAGEGVSEEDDEDNNGYYSDMEKVYFPSDGLGENTIVKIVTNVASSRDLFGGTQSKTQTDGKELWHYEAQFYHWDGKKLTPARHTPYLTQP